MTWMMKSMPSASFLLFQDGIDVKELNDILFDKNFSNFELVKRDVKKKFQS